MLDIPFGYCHCGCGQLAPLATSTNAKRGARKGQPLSYIGDHYWRHPDRQLIPRFWSQVDKRGDDECWLWTGTCSGNESAGFYGAIRAQRETGSRKILRAHRLSYELAYGKIPDGLFVLHRCDVTRCVNPAHLFLGTIRDNNRDRAEKGRSSKHRKPRYGETNPAAKLTQSQVDEMRQLYDSGAMRVHQLAKKYDLHRSTIGHIVHRQTWK